MGSTVTVGSQGRAGGGRLAVGGEEGDRVAPCRMAGPCGGHMERAGWRARRRRRPGGGGDRGDSEFIAATGRIGVRGRRCHGQRDGSPRWPDTGWDSGHRPCSAPGGTAVGWRRPGSAPPPAIITAVRTRLAAATPVSGIRMGGYSMSVPYARQGCPIDPSDPIVRGTATGRRRSRGGW
ncbi:hypothetical protein PAHAL_2G114400 [Panicum hallii]|uniref:Uncharacterized protein n=1 Tax=Panicum hallii TaxID=206008 RepID=A0A2T8KNP8_9POAL|nr:hypothetical protein PAHAL_2G114400 [Panicum hallii]